MTTLTVTDGQELRQRRERAGMSRMEVAAAAECSTGTIQLLEAGAIRQSRVIERVIAVLEAAEAAD